MKKLVGITLFFLLLAVVFDKSELFFKYEQKNEFSVSSVQKTLEKKENQIDTILLHLCQKIQKKEYCELSSSYKLRNNSPSLFSDSELQHIGEKGFTVLVYQNFDLKYWSDNIVPTTLRQKQMKTSFLDVYLKNKIIDTENGVYVVHSIRKEDKILIGLILIKRQYTINNNFLQASFQKDFDLAASVDISFIKDEKNAVSDKQGNFLFSLTPTYSSRTEKPFFLLVVVSYTLFLLCFFLLIANTLRDNYRKNKSWLYWLYLLIIILIIRTLLIYFSLPANFYVIELFQPFVYGVSFGLPSLGDLLIHSILIIAFSYYFQIPIKFEGETKKFNRKELYMWTLPISHRYDSIIPKVKSVYTYLTLIALLLGVSFFFFINYLFDSLIRHSQISFDLYNFRSINQYTFIGLAIIGLLFTSLYIVIEKVVRFCVEIVNFFQYVIISLIAIFITSVAVFLFSIEIQLDSIIFIIAIFIFFSYFHYKNHRYNYYTFVLLIFITSLYTVTFFTLASINKEKETRILKAGNLASERDHIAEYLLEKIEEKLPKDRVIREYIESQDFRTINDDVPIDAKTGMGVVNYLSKRYFTDAFWHKYTFNVRFCGTSKRFAEQNNLDNCIRYFSDMVKQKGVKVPNTNYYFMNNMNGTISYLGFYEYQLVQDSSNVTMFLSLDSKLIPDNMIGYPDLLLDAELKLKISNIPDDYSYAKYLNNQLIAKKGTFAYSLSKDSAFKTKDEISFIESDHYNHAVCNVDDKNTIILSKPSLNLIDVVISLSYIFLFFNLVFVIQRGYLILRNWKTIQLKFTFGFKTKIVLTMIIVLLLSFFLVGSGTVYYDIKKSHQAHEDKISERIESVITALEQQYPEPNMLAPHWQTDYDFLETALTKLSLSLFIDINMYDLDGKLMASSRPEIFEKKIIGQQMNPEAYRQLKVNKKAKFLQEEQIGETNYSSVYMPFKSGNQLIAYVNLPYITRPGELGREISNLVVTVVNLYVFLLLITISVAIFLSDKITHPLRILQNKFQEIELGKTNEQLFYNGSDEIGNLVHEYNRMVVELAKSVDLLAKSERESAWREMAKQIAHEIKNPLTPMKLNIQFLLRSSEEMKGEIEIPKFKKRLEGVSKTLVEQIDTLSRIATEFSNFAKMPKANNEMMNIVEVVSEIAKLFANSEEAKVQLLPHHYETLTVFADKEQLSRVFINLIKNGIQAIPENKEGQIRVKITANDSVVRVCIEDNGTGIPEEVRSKIFSPSFTTKNSGMGMGLAIVKNIVESAEGTIWFETEINKGTRFFVELARKDFTPFPKV